MKQISEKKKNRDKNDWLAQLEELDNRSSEVCTFVIFGFPFVCAAAGSAFFDGSADFDDGTLPAAFSQQSFI